MAFKSSVIKQNTLCLRIGGAFTLRFSRRHSTIAVSFCLIFTLLLIFKLYSSEHHKRHNIIIGDFEYEPAAFLRGQQPGNKSFCEFNYGFPDDLNWTKIPIDVTPELGVLSNYRVIYNAIKGKTNKNYTKYNAVTYATHATPEFLFHITEIAKYWNGPISLAVYVPNYDISITMQIMKHLCHCYHGMTKVSLHLVYPIIYKPVISMAEDISPITEPTSTVNHEELLRQKAEKYRNLDEKSRASYVHWVREDKAKRIMLNIKPPPRTKADRINFPDCSRFVEFHRTYRRLSKLLYPVNVARNVARNASTTNYFLVSDIEMVPSRGLATKFLKMLRSLMGDKKRDEGCLFANTVFVVPLFEVERGEEIPRDKDTLIQLVKENRASYFHKKTCSHCQRFPGLQSWLKKPSPDGVEPHIIARREFPYHRWEPIYFGTSKDPWYSEDLSWEGKQDKMTQMLEICLRKYRLVVLDGGFLVHAATSSTTHYFPAEKENARIYFDIIMYLTRKYKVERKCKVNTMLDFVN